MIIEYFDKNPLSSLGILTMNSGLCITLADISMNKNYLIK
jgi:hypothetical protein